MAMFTPFMVSGVQVTFSCLEVGFRVMLGQNGSLGMEWRTIFGSAWLAIRDHRLEIVILYHTQENWR